MRRFILLVGVLIFGVLFVGVQCWLAPNASAQTYRWAQSMQQPTTTRLMSLASDRNGNVFSLLTIKHGTHSIAGIYPCGDVVLQKRDSNGVTVWSTTLNGNASGLDLAVDSSGYPIITGAYYDTLTIGDTAFGASPWMSGLFLAKFDANGRMVWAQADTSDHNEIGSRMGFALAADRENNIYLSGMSGDITSFFSKIAPTGEHLWTKTIIGVRTFDDIAVAPTGELYVSGTCETHAKFDSLSIEDSAAVSGYVIFVASFDNSGNTRWLRADQFGTFTLANCIGYAPGRLYRYRYANDLNNRIIESIDPNNGALLGYTTLIMPAGSIQYISNTLTASATSTNAFICDAKADTAIVFYAHPLISTHGIFEDVRAIDSIASTDISAQAITRFGNQLIFGGSFRDASITFDEFAVTNQHDVSKFEDDLYLVKYEPFENNLDAPVSRTEEPIELYPNPCANLIRIHLDAQSIPTASAEIYSLLGQQVASWRQLPASLTLDTAELPAGSYQFVLTTSSVKIAKRFIKN